MGGGGVRILKTQKATPTFFIFEGKVVLFSSNQASNHYGELYMSSATLIRLLRIYYKLFNSTACKLPVQNVLEKSL